MKALLKALPFVALAALAGPVLAQAPEAEGEAGETPNPMELSMGEDAAQERPLGGIYVESEFNDWQLRCIVSQAEVDPCQLYQLLDDGQGNPVAEINIFPLPEAEEAAAGATVITPLETLLTQQLTLSVDGGQGKRYPFSWCSEIGCFSRIGLTDGDISSFKRGANATLTIVPVAAPDQKVQLKVSLSGFTAAFTAATERMQQAAAAAAAAAQSPSGEQNN